MKLKIYLLLFGFFFFSGTVLYLPMNTLNFSSEPARNVTQDDIYGQMHASDGSIQWTANGTVICNEAPNNQDSPQLCSDGAGGAIIAWMDYRSGTTDIFAQKITSNGSPQWTANGMIICNEATQSQEKPKICSDGAGGAIIAWKDNRNSNYDIFTQKITSNGSPQWTANGTVICNENTQEQHDQQICSDGAGGAIIVWVDERNSNSDIYAQKIASNGITQWTANGTVICNETTQDQSEPQICSDGAGGAIIAWQDNRNGVISDIYAQKIASNGITQWTANGTVICNETTEDQYYPQICSDGSGGAIIAWLDTRNGNDDIYAQKIASNGITQWTANGTVVCNEATTYQLEQRLCSDGAGGAIIAWTDPRNGNDDIYAQKIASNGNPQWTANGIVICNEAIKDQYGSQICIDGAGGANIVWEDERTGVSDIYAQKIASDGSPQWAANGTVICNEATATQYEPQICSDEAGGAIIAWTDQRNGNEDIYVQKIKINNGLPTDDDDDNDDDDNDEGKVNIPGFDLPLILGLLLSCGLIRVIAMRKRKISKKIF